jgi:hypothetical protein
MSVFVRCRKCSSFHSYREECKCDYRGKEDIRDDCIYISEETSKSNRSRAVPLTEELADFFN